MLLLDVEAVAGEELVGDDEADVPHGQVVDQAAIRPIQERHCGDRARLPKLEGAYEVVQRQPGVDDVFDDEHVTIADVGVEEDLADAVVEPQEAVRRL